MPRLSFAALAVLLLAASVRADGDGFLPTPYTADQIREASREPVDTVSRTTTPAGTSYTLDRISVVDEERASFRRQPLDESREPAGEPTAAEASWEELRRHALFPESRATRERQARDTALGPQEGWLYVVQGEDGAVSEFFFADRFPGPPLVYSRSRAGELVFRVEQIEKNPRTSE